MKSGGPRSSVCRATPAVNRRCLFRVAHSSLVPSDGVRGPARRADARGCIRAGRRQPAGGDRSRRPGRADFARARCDVHRPDHAACQARRPRRCRDQDRHPGRSASPGSPRDSGRQRKAREAHRPSGRRPANRAGRGALSIDRPRHRPGTRRRVGRRGIARQLDRRRHLGRTASRGTSSPRHVRSRLPPRGPGERLPPRACHEWQAHRRLQFLFFRLQAAVL